MALNYKIDWLTLTIKPESYCVPIEGELDDWVFDFLGLNKIRKNFLKYDRVSFYDCMYVYNDVAIKLSSFNRFYEQGLCINFSGNGVAFYEHYMKEQNLKWNWKDFLAEFFSLGAYGFRCKCTRIDLAFDDISESEDRKDYLLDYDKILKSALKGDYVSLFARDKDHFIPCEGVHERNRGVDVGKTLYFGKKKSDVYVRFYDKLLEREQKKIDVDDNIKHWVRMEFVFKDVRAMAVCDSMIYLDEEEFGIYISQVVNRYIRFVYRTTECLESNNYRARVKAWWRRAVGQVKVAKLEYHKEFKNAYYATSAWLKRCIYPTLYSILCCDSVDKFLGDVFEYGFFKQKKRHEQIVNDYIAIPKDELKKGLEAHKMYCSPEAFEYLLEVFYKFSKSARMKRQARLLYEACDWNVKQNEIDKEVVKLTPTWEDLNFKPLLNKQLTFDLLNSLKKTSDEREAYKLEKWELDMRQGV